MAFAKEEVHALEKQRDELVAQEETSARVKAEAERAQRLAELAAAKKTAAEAAARIAELETVLGEKKGP